MPTRPPRAQPFLPLPAVQRQSAHARGYGRRWEKIAKAFLAEHPICENPFGDHGLSLVPAEHVDHRVPRSRGGTDDASNLSALCARCHSKKTVMYDGGFGRAKNERHMMMSRDRSHGVSALTLDAKRNACGTRPATDSASSAAPPAIAESPVNALKQGTGDSCQSAVTMTGRYPFSVRKTLADQNATRRTFSRVLP